MRLAFVILILILVAGCSAPRVNSPLMQQYGKDDDDSQMEFWHRLNGRPMTTHDEAFHGLLLYLDDKDPNADYAGRVAELKRRGMIPQRFNRPADEAIQRGTLAMAILNVTNLRGGVMATVLGPTPRYATRELVYNGLYPPSSPNQTFSGAEFVGIIGRLEDYQRGDPANKPAKSLPSQPPTKIEE